MNWFFIAVLGSLLYSTTNHIDKYLISRYLKSGEVGSLIIFSAIFSIFALPIVYFIKPVAFFVTILQGSVLSITGMLTVTAILLYLYALSEDEATNVVPFYQTVPIFGFILGYLFLGETISYIQAIASFVIIVGAVVLSLDLGASKVRIKGKVVLYMLSSSMLYAISTVLFKLVAVDEGFWQSAFWALLGKVILGIFFLLFIPLYRNQFLAVVRENKFSVLSLNSFNETLGILADGFVGFATLLAPIALVLVAGAFQPMFTFIIGVILTIFFPKISKESLSKKHLAQKIVAITLIMIGTYFV
jgi:drug/metabolite transporter (DMT)-like permease